MKKFTRILAVVMAAVMAMTAMCVCASAATYSWTGTWHTEWGDMKLTQNGSKVTGTYEHISGTISGTVSGNVLSGIWTQTNGKGKFKFVMSSDGKSFTGSYGYNDNEPTSGGWNGTRDKATVIDSSSGSDTKTTATSDSMMIIYLEDGDKINIGALVSGKKASSVKFSTSDSKVATVSSKGKVKAKSPGTAVITAKSGSTTIKIQVVVEADD